MNRTTAILFFFIWVHQLSFSQTRNISGFVVDERSGEKLIGCNVILKSTSKGTSTDEYGYFHLDYSENGPDHIAISYVGFTTREIEVCEVIDSIIVVELSPSMEIPEVSVHRSVPQSLETASLITINPTEVNRMPSFFGEKDIFKTMQLKPGVQMGKEGSTGMIVRGGGPDQNQFLVDGVPLYYIQHLGNLLSAFNPDAVNAAYLIKGGFPAHYGGRLSSITDIRLKDGNNNGFTGSWTLGTLAFKGSLEGPIGDKTTFFLSGRRCNLDLITRVLSLIQSDGEGMAGYTFYDANLKIKHQVDKQNTLYLTMFSNRDKVFLRFWENDTLAENRFTFKSILNWGNHFASLRFNHVYNNKHTGDFSLSHSFFHYSNTISLIAKAHDQVLFDHTIINGTSINESLTRYEHNFFFSNTLRFRFGGGLNMHRFNPSRNFSGDTLWSAVSFIPEIYTYLVADYSPADFLKINAGFRNTLSKGKEQIFFSPEPRISVKSQLIPDQLSLTLSYSRMSQLVHLVSDNSGGIPVDIWLPATKYLPPEISDQLSLGLAYQFPGPQGFSFNLEGFVKQQKNLIELRPGNNIFYVLDKPEESIANNGTGTIHGVECAIAKEYGKLTGWLNYMYIRNRRQFDVINQGISYPYIYDKPHNLSAVLLTELNKNISLSVSWQISSGNLFTLPIGKYSVPDIYFSEESIDGEAHLYGSKNSTRLTPYHRLDLSLDFFKKLNQGTRIFNISLFNAYNKQNPFFLFYMENEHGETKLHQLSLFPLIPSFSYRYDF